MMRSRAGSFFARISAMGFPLRLTMVMYFFTVFREMSSRSEKDLVP